MLRRRFSPIRPLAAMAIGTLFAFVACSDNGPTVTGVEPPGLAKGGGGGTDPTVTAVAPTEAPQDVTLDVRVIGTGFDDGSSVKLLLNGKASKKVKTNSTRFESETGDLVANITIAIDAEVTSYDVEVTTSRRRKGVGTALFSVKEKTGFLVTGELNDSPQYMVRSDERGIYTAGVNCAAVQIFSTGFYMIRTVKNNPACHALVEPAWRYLTIDLGCDEGGGVNPCQFDFDQDGIAERLETPPARFDAQDAFDNDDDTGVGLVFFQVNEDRTTTADFKWFVTYVNRAAVSRVEDNGTTTLVISLQPGEAAVASLCEWVLVKKGKGGPGKMECVDQPLPSGGLDLPFHVTAVRTPLQ